jgi:hypothetical protein
MLAEVKLRFLLAGVFAASCLAEIDDPYGDGGAGGGGTTMGACVGECCPTDTICYPGGDPSAPGAECLASRDNRNQPRVQFRTMWTRTILPAANADDITYAFLFSKTALRLEQCNMEGQSGYIQLFDWDRSSSTVTEQFARVGYAGFAGDGVAAVTDGLCFLDWMYSDPEHGWNDMVHVKPSIARRVEADFDVSDPTFRDAHKDEEEGVFFYDEEEGIVHGYVPRAFLVIYESEDNLFVVPAHEAENRGRFNDPDSKNCQGRYLADQLDPNASCQPASQLTPPYGCFEDECPAKGDGSPGEAPITTTAYFLIEELEQVYVTLLSTTLCVSYMGQQTAIDEGWADPDSWGLNCSGSPRWQNGERPRGDWCSTTNAPATDDCADAWRSEAWSAAAATNIQDATCTTTAQ